jgi:type IV secretion system protein VirB1
MCPISRLINASSCKKTESNFNPWALHNNTTGISELPIDDETAFIDAKTWINHGDSVDIGLMQINSANLPALGMTIQSALDPCKSLEGGAAVLQAAYGGGQTSAERQVALLMALSRYNTGSPLRGIMNGYARRVMANASSAVPPPQRSDFQIPFNDPSSPPSWNVSAIGTYAQGHGAAWLIPLSAPIHVKKAPDSPSAPATMHDTPVANNLGIITTQEPARLP